MNLTAYAKRSNLQTSQFIENNYFQSQTKFYKRQERKTLTEPEHVLGPWKVYGHDLFAKPDNEIPVTKAPLTKTEPAPLLSEVEAAVNQMKLGKAAGLDGVPGELIRNAGPSSNESPANTVHKNMGKWRMARDLEKGICGYIQDRKL